jgi:hypothetical protein
MRNKKGQITIFVIFAIIIVAMIGIYFLAYNPSSSVELPPNIQPAYNALLTCIEENILVGVNILGSQAGYIDVPEFEAGSRYMPFSSQLDFASAPVPYWYYVSGNNIQKEQIPSEKEMEEQLEDFVEEQIDNCLFDEFYDQGYYIDYMGQEANINIKENKIDLSLDMPLSISKGEDNVRIDSHELSVNSNLGKLYQSAKEIYEYEQDTLFLEKYAVDTLSLYAPVDGYEISCSPLTWSADEVFNELENAIEGNTLALKNKGGDYVLTDSEDEYFVIDLPVEENVRFINSRNWAHGFEVNPSEEALLLASPVGNQAGLGILGFCYVPYHFVYNVRYPVLIQVYEGDEIFQFPVAVVLQNNNPREIYDTESVLVNEPQICPYKNTLMEINTFNDNGNVVPADISYNCLGEICEIGNSPLHENFPQCINGYVLAKAEGYKPAKIMQSTVENTSLDIMMEKIYTLPIELDLDGENYNGNALIHFISDDFSKTVIYPQEQNIELAAGDYEITVQVYEDSSLYLESTVQEQCFEVPSTGLGSLLGLTKTECFEIPVPEQTITKVLSGGGETSMLVYEITLKNANHVYLNVPKLKIPTSLEELQNNYILLENSEIELRIR